MHWRSLPYKKRRAILLRLLARDGWRCCICGLPIESLAVATVEHRRAQASGGGHDEGNLAPAHASCNYQRQDKTIIYGASSGRSFF